MIKFKTQYILIRKFECIEKIKAKVLGDYAYHRESRDNYNVTHVPSGILVMLNSRRPNNEQSARMFVQVLNNELKFKWNGKSIDEKNNPPTSPIDFTEDLMRVLKLYDFWYTK